MKSDLLPPAETAAAPPLRLLFWETTAGCNLACVHCRRLEVSHELSKLDLSTEQAKTMISTLPEMGTPILVFSGGEPLMRPDIFELAHHARDVGLPTALATNGTIMNGAIARKLVEAGVRRVSISLDGPNAATHDQFRGNGSFRQSMVGIDYLRKASMSVQINTTVARHNVQLLDQTYELALSLGADALHLFMLVPVGCGMELDPAIMLDGEEYERALNWIYDRTREGKLQLKATCAPHYFRVVKQRTRDERLQSKQTDAPTAPQHPHAGQHPHASKKAHGMAANTKGCLAGQSVCFVSHTGEVFPCGYLPVTSGNVTQTPLPTIWRDSQVFANLRDESNLHGKCGACEYNKVCMGCRARAYGFTGDYLAEEPSCDYQPQKLG